MTWELEDKLELVATLSTKVSTASIEMLRAHDVLTEELRKLAREGVSIDARSEATGLTPEEIRQRTDSDRTML
jgi:hypothetical protein